MLSDSEVKGQMEEGNILIDPYFNSQLNSNSYDVRLGEWFFRQKQYYAGRPTIRYGTADAMKLMWDEPIQANELIVVRARETILCHTEEFIGGMNIITTEMKAKSTTGRHCLSVCKCAGLGDVGYVSRWTMEMTNDSDFDVSIEVGERIAQITFHNVGLTESQYAGRYGKTREEWTPYDMLPKPRRA